MAVREQIMQVEQETTDEENKQLRTRQKELVTKLKKLQGVQPLVMPLVDSRTVADVCSRLDWNSCRKNDERRG